MNVSVNWLREMLPSLDAPAEEIAERISMTAVAVDAVTVVGEALSGVRVARVLQVREHPNADRLSLCRVDTGEGEPVDVVCGAPVIEEGALYPFVGPGGTLPGGFRIEAREIRGEASRGMLCSEHELRLGRDRSGILKLPDDLRPGLELTEALGLPDVRLTLDLTPNRVDLACHRGVARELAPPGETPRLRPLDGDAPEPEWADGREAAEGGGVTVRIEDPDRCRRYLGAVVRGVEVGPSPAWLAGRLRAVGVRPVNNVVDATNYVLHELNQPLHAFDLGTLDGPELRVRAAREGESLRTLDGQERELGPTDTVIADASRPVALAGVMGGEATEVTGDTRDIFLECAAFGRGYVRRTSRKQQLSTGASYRFERGIDETALEEALIRCAALVVTAAGGGADSVAVRAGSGARVPPVVELRPGRVAHLLGVELNPVELRRLLEPLGFETVEEDGGGDGVSSPGADAGRRGGAAGGADAAGPADPAAAEPLRVRVPGWRGDVTREVDLIEEVARRNGYDALPDAPRRVRPGTVADDPSWARADRVREHLVGRGFLEARSSTFVPERQPGGRADVRVLNPLSAQEGYLRGGMVPVLLRRVEHNFARGRRDVRLFEVGSVFGLGRPYGVAGPGADVRRRLRSAGFREELRAGVVVTGRRRPPHWSEEDADVDLWDAKGVADEVAEALCAGRLEPAGERREPGESTSAGGRSRDDGGPSVPLRTEWLEGRGFVILRDGEAVGAAGRVRDDAVDAPPWAAPVFALEFRLGAVEVEPTHPYEPIPEYPSVRRDLAVTVPRDVPAGAVETAIRAAGADSLESLELFDVYEGEGVEPDRRSLAWSFRFRSRHRTLTDEEVEEAMEAIVSSLQERCDARIRTS